MSKSGAQFVYGITCDDVRVELGNKVSLMGVFESVFFPAVPSMLLKFAVVNHWQGAGDFETQVRIIYPDRREFLSAVPARVVIESLGYADNITFFANVGFDRFGTYTIQTFVDGRVVSERPLFVRQIQQAPSTVN